jgi:hypothetical protein
VSGVTVTVDREALLDLLAAAHAVADTVEALGGVSPAPLTVELVVKAEVLAQQVLGECAPNFDEGARVELWGQGRRRSAAFLAELAEAAS